MDSLQQQDALALLSGDEAVALAAFEAGVKLGTGYPGTPSTEILETFEKLGGRAQWSPNEKVALEVGVGVAFAGARALVTMKHVGLNVAADPLFTVAYTRLDGALVIVSADDPGMASSQNEQDNRRYALAAGVPMLEPSDSQEAYEFTLRAIEISERWQVPVLLRMTTRVCHSKTIVRRGTVAIPPPHAPHFEHDFPSRVMIPAYAKPAHRRLRQTLAEIAAWNDETGNGEAGNGKIGNGRAGLNQLITCSKSLGIITSGVAFQHVREVAPEASVLKLGLTYPLPIERMRAFAAGVERCVVIEEGDPYLVEGARTAGIKVEGKPESFRFGELNTARVRRILEGDTTPEPKPAPGKPPALCPGCPHRSVYAALKELNCIVAGDIGCYSLGVLPPFEAMDTLVCMGAAPGQAGGERAGRQHLRAQRHHRPGRDGLQPAPERPCAGDPRQRDHGHDGHAGASGDRAHALSRQDRQSGLRGSGAFRRGAQCARDRSRAGAGKISGIDSKMPGLAGNFRGDCPPGVPAGDSLDSRVREVQ